MMGERKMEGIIIGKGTYKRRQILPTARLVPVALLVHTAPIPQHKRYLDDPRRPRRHQRIPKHRMHVRAQHQALRMRAHGPPGNQNHHGRDQIPLGPPVPLPTQPDTQQARTPPHDAHAGMLQIILDPRPAPAMFREGVDAAPRGDEQAVEEFLRSPRAFEPRLADEQEDGERDAVADEGGPHDEMREALTRVVGAAESQGRDPAEEHLHPADHGHDFPKHAVRHHGVSPHAGVDSGFPMQF